MTDLLPCYIAGPYGPAPGDPRLPEVQIQENVHRALMLGHCATLVGFTPVVPHAMGYAGCYGDPHEGDGEATRARALACGTALASLVGRASGALWIITRDDGTLSPGTTLEYDAFRATGNEQIVRQAWGQWLNNLWGAGEEHNAFYTRFYGQIATRGGE